MCQYHLPLLNTQDVSLRVVAAWCCLYIIYVYKLPLTRTNNYSWPIEMMNQCFHSVYDSVDCNRHYQTGDFKLRWGSKKPLVKM